MRWHRYHAVLYDTLSSRLSCSADMPLRDSVIRKIARNHFGSGRCESLKIVPVVTENR